MGLIASGVALSRRVSSVLKLLLQAREPAGREPSPSAGDTRLRHRGIGFAHDSLLEEAGFEPLVPPLLQALGEKGETLLSFIGQ